jgi:transcription antitermination factor NusG
VIERSPGFRLVMLNKSGSPLLATQSDIEAIIAREVRGEFDRLTFGHQPVSFRVGDEVVVIEGLIEGTVGTVAAVGRSITVDVANLPRPVHLLAKRLALR